MTILKSFLLLFVITSYSLQAATCTASNGAWSSASTWSCGRVPTAGDIAVVPSGVTVTVSQNQTTTVTTLNISGTISFSNGAKLTLPSTGIVNIFAGGQVSGGNNGSVLDIGGTPIYTGGSTPLTGPTTCTNGGCGALPVTLVAFKASILNKHSALLQWETINEYNSQLFTLKRGKELNNLSKIAQIDAIGESSIRQYYSYTDSELPFGIHYYQLEQMDKNGVIQYFRPISVIIEDPDFPFAVSPNPNSGQFFRVKVDNPENDTINLISVNGQSITIEIQREHENIFIVQPKQILIAGIYILHVKNNIYDKTYKIVVE